MSWKWTAALGVVTLALLVIFYRGFGRNPREVPFMLEGQSAPAFTAVRLDNGEPFRLEDAKGKPLVLNFWASWCEPCKVEHPVLELGAQRLGNEALFIGVVFDDTEERARQYLKENGSGFLQLLDVGSRMSVDYGVTGVPETYFIDAAGRIRHKKVGPYNPYAPGGLPRAYEELASHVRLLSGEGARVRPEARR